MNGDLTDVGLEALEALEAQDELDNSNSEDTGNEEENTTEDVNENEENVDNQNEDVNTSEDDTTDEDDGDTEDEPEDKEEDKKTELSDEEFEEMARKRGYARKEEKNDSIEESQSNKQLEELLKKPQEVTDEQWDSTPDINKIVYNSLPYIEAVGKDGETIKVKTPEQLPDDFEFASKKFEKKFDNDLIAQENRANSMLNGLTKANEERIQQEERIANAKRIISEVESLQNSGELPKPTAKPGTKEFDDDPAVQAINKILEYQNKRAMDGVKLTVKDSLLLYKAEHPEEFTKKEAKGDKERTNIAKKVAGNSKSTSTAVNKESGEKPQYYKVGMSTEDVLDRILDDMD